MPVILLSCDPLFVSYLITSLPSFSFHGFNLLHYLYSSDAKRCFLQNFDDVLVLADHVSRSYNDTYYVDSENVLRCHTSAHQAELLRVGNSHFLVTGDVYRRDSIDSTHYPVFHQVHIQHLLLKLLDNLTWVSFLSFFLPLLNFNECPCK